MTRGQGLHPSVEQRSQHRCLRSYSRRLCSSHPSGKLISWLASPEDPRNRAQLSSDLTSEKVVRKQLSVLILAAEANVAGVAPTPTWLIAAEHWAGLRAPGTQQCTGAMGRQRNNEPGLLTAHSC